MKAQQYLVKLFMEKAGQETPAKPCIPSAEIQQLRLRLHDEECFLELMEAFSKNDLALVADSIADSLVVILGTAVACGIDIEPIFIEVMHSNMTKFIDGYRDPGGKWIKGPSYTPTNIAPLIAEQIANAS